MQDNDMKKYKEFYKKSLFDEIREISEMQSKFIIDIEKLEKYIGLDKRISNVGTRLNNKLIELEHEFEKLGISLYLVKKADDIIGIKPTFLGQAIISDLFDYSKKGDQNLIECYDAIRGIIGKKEKALKEIQRNPLKRFFAQIRNMIASKEKKNIVSYTENERNTINLSISKYEDISAQLCKYNLRDNITSSITKLIRKQKYQAFMIPELLEENVNPELQKLGLGDLIPELQVALIEEYKKHLPDSSVYQISEKDMYLHVPDFNRKIKSKEEILQIASEETVNEIKAIIEGEEEAQKSLREGATLEDFSSIDAMVSALERQEVTNIIDEALAEKQKISKKDKLEDNDISR